MDSLKILEQIEQEIRQLKARNEQLLAENKAYSGQIADYELQLEQAQALINTLNTNQNTQSPNVLFTEKEALRKSLEHYIQLIDACISAINATE